MTKTFRRKDIKYPKEDVIDGECWRGCDGLYCSICSESRQNKKIKERLRGMTILNDVELVEA